MFLNQRTANALGYISLVVLLILVLLTWLGVMPSHLRLPVFFLALALFMGRITLRLLLGRRQPREGVKEDGTLQK
jgi:Flp pilus assembly protein TadB